MLTNAAIHSPHRLGHAIPRRLLTAIACLSALAVAYPAGADDQANDDHAGARVYQEKCAVCHGPKGEGTDDYYPMPLVGDRPLVDLARLIEKTMPEGEPEECVGEEARKVAAYIYDAFYSPIAQARNRPARVELSRLTVRQYENAVADLIGGFSWSGRWDDERGLEAEYFKSRLFRNEHRVIERRDATVDFDFGESSPDAEQIEAEEFAIRWQGAIFAPETGEYEFILETDNGARLWVNDNRRALIDAWVRSGDETEYRESIRLLGGRVYPLRLEFFKFKEPRASIRLKWKPPHQAEPAT
jgi:mono/diheme cytochrome c family protein